MHPEERPCFLRRVGAPRSYGQCNFPKGSRQFGSLWVLLSILGGNAHVWARRPGNECGKAGGPVRNCMLSRRPHTPRPQGGQDPFRGPIPARSGHQLPPAATASFCARLQFAPARPMRPGFSPSRDRETPLPSLPSPLTGTFQAVSEPRDSG